MSTVCVPRDVGVQGCRAAGRTSASSMSSPAQLSSLTEGSLPLATEAPAIGAASCWFGPAPAHASNGGRGSTESLGPHVAVPHCCGCTCSSSTVTRGGGCQGAASGTSTATRASCAAPLTKYAWGAEVVTWLPYSRWQPSCRRKCLLYTASIEGAKTAIITCM